MVSKRKVSLSILILVSLILTISTFFYLQQEKQDGASLVTWGKRNEECLLWVVNPAKPESYNTAVGEASCNYEIVQIDGKPSLVHVQNHPAKISFYDVHKDGEITLRQTISLPEIEITSDPQWAPGDLFYFSAIQNKHEAIYRYNNQSGTLEKSIQHPQAIASEPIISPDGRYLSYWFREGLSSRHECIGGIRGDCFQGHYYLADLENNTQVDILSLLENPLLLEHCKLTWSPTGRFLAFQIGCVNFPNQIAILDMQSVGEARTINPADASSSVVFNGWLSDTDLVYEGGVFFDQFEKTFPRNQVFSVETNTSRELADFPVFISEDEPFRLFDINWTLDTKYMAGEGYGTFDEASTIIANSSGEFSQMRYSRFHAGYPIPPTLSPSGNGLAFFSGDQTNGYTPILNLVDIQGESIYSLELAGINGVQLGWVLSSN